MSNPTVAILMGSKSDLDLMRPAQRVLEELEIPSEMRVMSAHRTPARTAEFTIGAEARGIKVIICGAGGAAHLAGAVAAHTTLPVIGVPLARTPLGGNDALLATVQMPKGMPVATVAIDGAANGAILAAQMIALSDSGVRDRIRKMRLDTAERVAKDDASLAAS
jgi:5-(carboxyamino)imidazole ribonucleotide mutase